MEPVRSSAIIPLPPDAAFERFTAGMSEWWPREFTWSGPDALEDIGIEPGVGGKLYEIGPVGMHWDWGRVLAWDPPNVLVFSWQISARREPIANSEDASEVGVRFVPDGTRTRVEVEHRAWERHGDGAEQYRAAFGQAWDHILQRFKQSAQES